MFILYRTTNLINGRFYIGVHSTDNPNDDYLGSGKVLRLAVIKYGKHNFKKEVLFTYVREYYAYKKEEELVREARKDHLCYNVAAGGMGGWKLNHNLTESMRIFRANHMKSLNANPTPKMTEAKRLNMLRLAKNPPESLLVHRRSLGKVSITCEICGIVCHSHGGLGRHKACTHGKVG